MEESEREGERVEGQNEEPKKIDTKDLKHTQQGRRSRTQAG